MPGPADESPRKPVLDIRIATGVSRTTPCAPVTLWNMPHHERFAAMDSVRRAYTLIKSKILEGEILPNTTIPIMDIADQLGLSNTPVRQALVHLVGEQLVYPIHPRGYMLRILNEEDVLGLYHVNVALISSVIESPKFHISQADLESLRMMDASHEDVEQGGKVELVEGIFLTISKQSNISEVHRIIGNINDRLHAVRKAELNLFYGGSSVTDDMFGLFDVDIRNRMKCLRKYHMKRVSDIHNIAREYLAIIFGVEQKS